MPPYMTKMNQNDAPTERFNTTRRGAMAVSGIENSTATKATNSTANVTRRPIIFGDDQGSVVPPHCKARTRLMIDGTSKKKPIGSRRIIFVFKEVLSFDFFGRCKNMKTMVAANPPIGRLM